MFARYPARAFVLAATLAALPVAAEAGSFQTVYTFTGGADGFDPIGGLIRDSSGALYGVTTSGGSGGGSAGGVVYKFDPATSKFTTLYAFTAGTDGATPGAGLVMDGAGRLYGTTQRGGTAAGCNYLCGTVFRLDPATGKLTTLYTFTGQADGFLPAATLVLRGGLLYGTTYYGGTTDCNRACGTLFKLAPATKTLTTLHEFTATEGIGPQSKLVFLPTPGLFYGTLTGGGAHASGAVFSINPTTNAFAVVHAFDYSVDGTRPTSNLVYRGGKLYGTTNGGGSMNTDATIYALNPTTGALATLHTFSGSDGIFPTYGVTFDTNGLAYGPATQGGSSGAGTLFSLKLLNSVFTKVHDFAISDGSLPAGPPVADSTGALYGVTSEGGSGHGTIFKYVP
jgi:uncharacterized repeat protein (TIGR03803 family)